LIKTEVFFMTEEFKKQIETQARQAVTDERAVAAFRAPGLAGQGLACGVEQGDVGRRAHGQASGGQAQGLGRAVGETGEQCRQV
jgi:hypothetical protein